jgi:catechol 2,3-dioxygenase-like lactoylglutathione lyase family enzyme
MSTDTSLKVTGLVLWVQDAGLSAKFYKKIGFEVVSTTERDAVVKLGGFELSLVTMRDEDEFNGDSLAAEKGKGMYVYIQCDDVDAFHSQLKDGGITPRTEPRDWEWGRREFVVHDPDGYKLCFWARSSQSS